MVGGRVRLPAGARSRGEASGLSRKGNRMSTVCLIEGCDRPAGLPGTARGWCHTHYRRWQRHGDPLGQFRERPPKGSTLKETFAWYRPGQPPTDSCWDWEGNTDAYGYGALGRDGRVLKAHRVSYELHVGPIPTGAQLLHSCDRPICVNPNHLRPGNARANTDDALERDRVRKGERHGQSKLTKQDVREMRQKRAQGRTIKSLSEEYGISYGGARDAISGKNWKHLSEEQ